MRFCIAQGMDRLGLLMVWFRFLNTRQRGLLTWFETILSEVLSALEPSETLT